ncbi:MAG: hypothetical protein CVU95_15455 [Firmicutes bacterium HGW-Firmicutes-2]|jgi:hypothetical protein|nr:MAG: hypothetical protein CVU95_15455 [Firmicutes bacterium HGW-Firmicutes-2]
MHEIKKLAVRFRNAIESAREDRRFSSDQSFRNFPVGCCGITTELLAKFLMDNGIDDNLTYISGTYREDSQEPLSHAWLTVNNEIVVDITGDQFRHYSNALNCNETVYVGGYNERYNSFEIDEEEICNNYYPLDDRCIRSHLSRKKLYEIILEYIVIPN